MTLADRRAEISHSRADVAAEISSATQAQTRSMMFIMMGAVLLLILTDALRGVLT